MEDNFSRKGHSVLVKRVRGFGQRLRGLLGYAHFPAKEYFLFENCNAVHTWGMRFTIDVAMLNQKFQIVSIFPRLRPFRWARDLKAWAVLEMPEGTISKNLFKVGEELFFKSHL